jgi:hypothetical protein
MLGGLSYGGLVGMGEVKAPRFKPTKEQLDILIAAYDKNKWVDASRYGQDKCLRIRNPDVAMREALARELGGDVKPKTLQIWFQNRSVH